MDLKNDLRGDSLPSQYNCFDRIENSEYSPIPVAANKPLTASMEDKAVPYRYHPPLQFQPTTPPTKTRCNNLTDKPNQFSRRSPVCSHPNGGSTAGLGSTVIDCSQPQVRLSWRNHVEKSLNAKNNDPGPRNDLQPPIHTRQRSMPVSMPSYEKNPLLSFNGLLNVDTESTNLSRTSSTGNMKSNALLAPSGSYNVVIDIQLRGLEPINFTNRMTQSFIEDGEHRIKMSSGLSERQRSMNEIPRSLLDSINNISFDSKQQNVRTGKLKMEINPSSRHQSSGSNISHKPSVCPELTDDSTTSSLDMSSDPVEFDDVANPEKTQFTCCTLSHAQTPIPARRRGSNTLGEQTQVKTISWSPTRAARSSSTSMLRTERNSTWAKTRVVNFSNNIDVPQLIRLLQSPDPDVVANASAYLQHLVYRNPSLKDKTRQCGGIAALVQLLYSDHAQICLNTVGVLRNLTSGDNLEIKDELERVGGIRALAWLIENRQGHVVDDSYLPNNESANNGHNFLTLNEATVEAFRPSLENAAAVLCNLAGVDHLKRSVLHEALLPSLINRVIRVVANYTVTQESAWSSPSTSVPYNYPLFRNTIAVVRNVSSMDNTEYREQLRQCPWLIWSLITVIRASIVQQCTDLKSIEHCVCSIRNLSYSIHHSFSSNQTDPQKLERTNLEHKSSTSKFRLRSSSLRSKRMAEEELKMNQYYHFSMDNPVGLLFRNQTIQVLLDLLQQSSNPCTLEATAGTLQNLTAGNWNPSRLVKEAIRTRHGLPVLTELLNAPSPRVILAVANALRNLATENPCCALLGKHALPRIISALSNCETHVSSFEQPTEEESLEWQMPNSEYQTNLSIGSGVYGSSFGSHVSKRLMYAVTSALLQLCAVLVYKRIEHARRFATLGGMEKCIEIYHATKQSAVNPGEDNDKHLASEVKHRTHQLAEQLLHLMWNFTELRPIYKLAGWRESDFGIAKRGSRLGSLVRRNSKKTLEARTHTSNDQPHQLVRKSDSLSLVRPTSAVTGWPPRARNNVPLYVRDLRTHKHLTSRNEIVNSNRSYPDPPGTRSGTLPAQPFDRETPELTDSTWSNRRWTNASRPEAVYVPATNAYNPSPMDFGSDGLASRSNFSDYGARPPCLNTTPNHMAWTGRRRNNSSEPSTLNGDVPDSWV